MKNKTALITGGTGGIGKAIAASLALKHYTVYITGRNPQKANRTVDELRQLSGHTEIYAWTGDLSIRSEIDCLVTEIKAKVSTLDVLINNVGILTSSREKTTDGFEKVFFVNHLLPFYLTHSLWPMIAPVQGRIINVTGGVYAMGKPDIHDPELKNVPFKPLAIISNAKLALVMSSRVWARKLADKNIAVLMADPGVAKSGMGHANKAWPWWFRSLMPLMETSTAEAAQSTVYAATAPELKGKTGLLLDAKCRIKTPANAALAEDLANKIWLHAMSVLKLPEYF